MSALSIKHFYFVLFCFFMTGYNCTVDNFQVKSKKFVLSRIFLAAEKSLRFYSTRKEIVFKVKVKNRQTHRAMAIHSFRSRTMKRHVDRESYF